MNDSTRAVMTGIRGGMSILKYGTMAADSFTAASPSSPPMSEGKVSVPVKYESIPAMKVAP